MMYHREPCSPIDSEVMHDNINGHGSEEQIDKVSGSFEGDTKGSSIDYVKGKTDVCNNLKPLAMKNIKKSQESQKKYYDKRHGYAVMIIVV